MNRSMVFLAVSIASFFNTTRSFAQSPERFTLQQALSAPYATSLTAAPVGNLFAWVEDREGRHNLFVGVAGQPARQLTHNAEDDAQDISQLAWAPDGSAIAYTYGAETGAAGKPANPAHLQRATPVQVMLQPIAPGTQSIALGEGHAALFLPGGRSILYVHSGQIWTANTASPVVAHQLVFDRGAASELTISPDGNQVAFVSRRREENEPAHSYVALFNLITNTLSFPAASAGNDFAPVFSPDGKSLAWLRGPFTKVPEFAANRVSANPWSIQMLDLATGVNRTIFSPEPNRAGSALPHMADGEPRLFFLANDALDFFSEADGWLHLYELNPTGDAKAREIKWLTPGAFEVEEVVFARDRSFLLYASNEAAADTRDRDRRHLWRLELGQQDTEQADTPPVELTYGAGIETHPQIGADGSIAALVSDARVPMHPAMIGKDGEIAALDPESLPVSYPAAMFVVPQQVLLPTTPQPSAADPALPVSAGTRVRKPAAAAATAGGSSVRATLTLHGQLFVAKDVDVHPSDARDSDAKAKRPAILFFHGGPNRQMLLGYPAMDYYSNAYAMNQYLASRGFIVLSVNYRCGIGYGLEFRQCTHAGATGAEEYNDVLAAVKYLRSRPDVDASRIGIWGGSYGGYLTALALARNSNLFAAGVDFHGVHDWNLEDNAGDWKMGTWAQQDAIAAKATASSPIADVAHWTSPVLLIHGDDDPNVAYAQTPTLAEALRARSVAVQELIFPDELHGFLLHKDWLAAYVAAAAFFEQTLKDRGER